MARLPTIPFPALMAAAGLLGFGATLLVVHLGRDTLETRMDQEPVGTATPAPEPNPRPAGPLAPASAGVADVDGSDRAGETLEGGEPRDAADWAERVRTDSVPSVRSMAPVP
jgi:hypothetical protein